MTEVLQATAPPTMMPTFEPNVPGRMTQIPQFAFPARPNNDHEGDRLSTTSRLEPPARSHRRARTSVNVTPPLPSFSFGGASSGASSASSTPVATEPAPEQSLLPTTPSSRHRRAVSEYVGDKPEMKPTTEETTAVPQALPISSVPAKAHRHRRSGAVSSQDLSSLQRPQIPSPDLQQDTFSRSGDKQSGTAGDGMLTPATEMASPTPQGDPDSPSRTVSFSDEVIRHNPRPMSVVSSESSSSQSTIRDTRATPTEELSNPLMISTSHSIPSTQPSLAYPDDTFLSSVPDDGPGTGIDILELDENFDHDPTEAIADDFQQDSYLPYLDQSMQEPRLSPAKSSFAPDTELAAPQIDLDFASVDRPLTPPRPIPRGSGFQKARASMHSAGSQSGALASSFVNHRRTESAPSLSASPFLPRDHAAEAGFEMTAVFEEDEEDDDDDDAFRTPEQKPFSEVQSDLMAVTSDNDQTPKPLVGKRDTHSSPSLLPPFQYSLTNYAGHDDVESSRRSPHTPVSLPRPPFASYDDQSASNKSSPKYAQSCFSSCEPSPSTFHHSVDDVPSLISGGSTVGEATVAEPSIKSLDPDFGVAGSTSSLAPSTRRHRKRLSVMSMSMSMPRLFISNSFQSEEVRPSSSSRSQSTAGATTPKPAKPHRIRRFFSMFKKSS